MTDKAPKSAYELAMEKLRARDREKGIVEEKALTEDQKRRIAEIRSQAKSKLAELEIFWQEKQPKLIDDAEAMEKAQKEYVADRRRVEERAEADIEKVRGQTRAKPGRGASRA